MVKRYSVQLARLIFILRRTTNFNSGLSLKTAGDFLNHRYKQDKKDPVLYLARLSSVQQVGGVHFPWMTLMAKRNLMYHVKKTLLNFWFFLIREQMLSYTLCVIIKCSSNNRAKSFSELKVIKSNVQSQLPHSTENQQSLNALGYQLHLQPTKYLPKISPLVLLWFNSPTFPLC